MAEIKKDQEREELFRRIYKIATDLVHAGHVAEWDFKSYVLPAISCPGHRCIHLFPRRRPYFLCGQYHFLYFRFFFCSWSDGFTTGKIALLCRA